MVGSPLALRTSLIKFPKCYPPPKKNRPTAALPNQGGSITVGNNFRLYGTRPYTVVAVHGGPGAAGAMAPVAQVLASDFGVLEPLQTAKSVTGQIEELREITSSQSNNPVTLIGHSWGAWLSYLLAAKYPEIVNKLILVASGPFEANYAENLMQVRRSRLSQEDNLLLDSLLSRMQDAANQAKNTILQEFGSILSKADSYDPVPGGTAATEVNLDIFKAVWPEAAEIRKTGELVDLGKYIKCPVVAIHGAYDPHPHEGVHLPLRTVLQSFKFVLLERCGHTPWAERHAREDFFSFLRDELRDIKRL